MVGRSILASLGVSSLFSGLAYEEWAKSPSASGALYFVGSVGSALVAYGLARRAEEHRERLDERKERRHVERLERLAKIATANAMTPDQLRTLDDLDGPGVAASAPTAPPAAPDFRALMADFDALHRGRRSGEVRVLEPAFRPSDVQLP